MPDAKDVAIDLAEKLAVLEAEAGISPNNPFHKALRAGLVQFADDLGLSADDIAEIDAAGHTMRQAKGVHTDGGGTGKDD